MWRRTKRTGLGLAITVVALAAIGAVYQQVMVRVDARTYAPPGRFIEVSSARMHLYCTGTGSPTVLLEAGATGFAQTWGWIQPRLATSTRVCSYDRMGMGWSEKTEGGHDGLTIARNLRALLTEAGETEPFVVVGHSLGGSLVRIFTALHPDDVVAVGLIDPSHEDQLARFPSGAVDDFHRFRQMFNVASKLTHFGMLRATNAIGQSAAGLPERDFGTTRMFAASPKHLHSSYAELAEWKPTMDATRANRTLGDRPLVVVSAAALMPGMSQEMLQVTHEMHEELVALSSRGQHHVVAEADHFSLPMRREHAEEVSAILLSLVDDARQYTNSRGAGPTETT